MPAFSLEAGARADFLGESGGAAAIASVGTEDGDRRDGGDSADASRGCRWRGRLEPVAGSRRATGRSSRKAAGVVARIELAEEGWRLSVGDAAPGAPVPGDVAAIVTGTAADILLLDAAVGLLADGDTRDLVAWFCGPTLDCDGVQPRVFTVTGLGNQLIRGHRIYESTNAYHVLRADGGEGDELRYWVATPGLFSGGPVRVEVDGEAFWRRIR